MEFSGVKSNHKYTITVENLRVESVLVESTNSCKRRFYQRDCVKADLAINRQVFQEAVSAICKGDPDMWEKLYLEIRYDIEYARLMQSAYKKYIKGFLEKQIHKESFWELI